MRDRRCPQESEGLPPGTRWCRAPEEREMREWLASQQLLLSAGRSYYDVQRKKQAAETKAGVELHFEIIPVSLRDCSKWQRDSRLIPYLSYTWVSFDLPNISQPSEANLPPLSERSFRTLPIELPCSPGFQDSLCFLPAMMNEGSACRVESRPGGRQPGHSACFAKIQLLGPDLALNLASTASWSGASYSPFLIQCFPL